MSYLAALAKTLPAKQQQEPKPAAVVVAVDKKTLLEEQQQRQKEEEEQRELMQQQQSDGMMSRQASGPDVRLRGIEKRRRDGGHDDHHKYDLEKRFNKRNGSCTRKLNNGNSQASPYCCRGYYRSSLVKVHEPRIVAREAKKALDQMKQF